MNTFLSILQLLYVLVPNAIHVDTGKLTYYNPGVMEMVYRNRISMGHVSPCKDCVGMLAVRDCKYLNHKATLQVTVNSKPKILGPFLIVDCSNRKHLAAHIRSNLIAEVDWKTSRTLKMHGPLYNVVLKIN